MPTYSDTLTVREAREQYFTATGFSEEDYHARWVRVLAGPVPLYFPNSAARVRAVRYHDVHHVLTQYDTTWTGEAEIGAWEIASGCAHHYAAWLLNLQAMAIGLVINSEAVFRAFLRGRQTGNLYHAPFDEALLSATVGASRRQLRLDAGTEPATLSDRVSFAKWALVSVVTLVTSTLLVLVPLAALLTLIFLG